MSENFSLDSSDFSYIVCFATFFLQKWKQIAFFFVPLHLDYGNVR